MHDFGERLGSRDLLDQAIAYAQTIDWKSDSNARQARLLIYLASHIAQFDPAHADKLLDTYYAACNRADGLACINIDTGEAAEEQIALAQISLSRGETATALKYFDVGLNIFEKIGYKARIAAVSFEIGKITRDRRKFKAAEEWAVTHPRSILACKMSEFIGATDAAINVVH